MPTSNRDQTVFVAGDIARCGAAIRYAQATADLVADIPGIVLTTGDHAYENGTPQEFRECYAPTWGAFRERTRPVPGNHDRRSQGLAGYFGYFGTRAGPLGRGYYTFMAGTWRVFALDSTVCEDGGCARGSAQFAWLRRWLKRDRSRCVIASWHHPPFSSGRHGNNDDVRPLVSLLYNAGAEIVVAGHDHNYERFAPLRPSGERDAKYGVRSFVVGTGGTWLREIPGQRAAGSQAVNADTHGVLRLRLRPGSYDWRFLPAGAGTFTDAGRGTCHGRPS